MNFYRDHIFLPIMNKVMDNEHTAAIRSEVCAPLAGAVVEIGFGTGLNLPHLPDAITRLWAVEPIERGRAKAAERLKATHIPVEFVGLDAQGIPLADGVADAALSTWTLCSIPDAVAAVREVSRILRPGGSFHFAEHGLAPESDVTVRRWQNRLNGFQQKTACGCSLVREIPSIIESGGLVIEQLKTFYAKGQPKTHAWTFQGTAHRRP